MSNKNLFELLAKAHEEAQQAEKESRLRGWLQALAVIAIVIAALIYFL